MSVFGIYNEYAEEWWMQTCKEKPMVFPTEQAARNFIKRLEMEDGQVCDESEASVKELTY